MNPKELIELKEKDIKKQIKENEKWGKWAKEMSEQIRDFLGQEYFDKYVEQLTKEVKLMKSEAELKALKQMDKLWQDRIDEIKNNIIADCDWGTNHGNNDLMAKGSIIKHLDKLKDLEGK